MVGTHHLWVRWQVPFSRNPFHPFPYFWRQPYTSKGKNVAQRCDSSVAFALKQYFYNIFHSNDIFGGSRTLHTHTRTQKTECSIAVWFVCRFYTQTIWVIPNNMWPPRSSPIHSRLFCCPQNRALEAEWSSCVQNNCKGHIQNDYWTGWVNNKNNVYFQ